MKVRESQKELLELHTDLLDKKIDLQKEFDNNSKIKKEVESLNQQSEKATSKYESSDPKSTAKDAKNTAKLLQKKWSLQIII